MIRYKVSHYVLVFSLSIWYNILKSICGLLFKYKKHSWLIERRYRQADRLWMQYNQYQPTRFWNCSICTGNKTEQNSATSSCMFWNCSICTGYKTAYYRRHSVWRFWNCSICTGNKTGQKTDQWNLVFWNCSICTGYKTISYKTFK